MAGKGDKLRPVRDITEYGANYDRIFGRKEFYGKEFFLPSIMEINDRFTRENYGLRKEKRRKEEVV